MDNTQWPQEIGLVNYIEGSSNTAPKTCTKPLTDIRREKPQKDQVLNCPRCNSTNTKFCYYNNYSLTQPRYFCKTCRRYWTEGGTLRNIPVGGISRKNKKASSSRIDSSKVLDHINNSPNLSQFSSQNSKTLDGQDLNLSFQATQDYDHGFAKFVEMPRIASRVLNSYVPMPVPDPNILYSSGFPLHELKPTLSFSVEGLRNGGFENFHGTQGIGNGRVLFPFGEVKQLSSTTEVDHNKGHENPTGYWNGMLGGGTW